MENQDVTMNDVERALCDKFHLKVASPDEDGYWTVTDRDPVLVAKKVKLPKHRGTDLSALILQAKAEQETRQQKTPIITVVETVVEPEPVVETVEPLADRMISTVEEDETEDEPEEEEEEAPSNVVSLRRAVLTEDDLTVPPSVLKDVILDDTGKKVRKAPVAKKTPKHRDNRFARAYRTILENPELTVAEQAEIAGVTPAMAVWYEIVLRSLYKIIYEKYGDDVIPMLPKLIKK